MLNINFNPFPGLTTERLILRQLSIEDEHEIFFLRTDESVNKFLDRDKANTIEDAREFINKINDGVTKNESILWAITFKNNNKLIGTICFWKISKQLDKAEIGYELLPDFQGKGIMQEAMAVVIKYGLEQLKLHTIEAELSNKNLQSVKLLERNGFTVKENVFHEGSHLETVVYTLINKK